MTFSEIISIATSLSWLGAFVAIGWSMFHQNKYNKYLAEKIIELISEAQTRLVHVSVLEVRIRALEDLGKVENE